MRRTVQLAALVFCGAAGGALLQPVSFDAAVHAQSAQASSRPDLQGGARGTVKTAAGQPVGGQMVQLISKQTSIRTTVFTTPAGQYEFPRLPAGEYALRLARPLEFRPYVREGVRIDGATALPEIVVERIAQGDYLPPVPELLTQLYGAEWVANMPGTGQEKETITQTCGNACHSADYLFRVTFDEANWRKLVHRMNNYNFRWLGTYAPGNKEVEERVVRWLATYRAPGAEIMPIRPFPRPQGPAARAVITEYDLPWSINNQVHDVTGDREGNIWFTPNRNPYVGKLDPKTGRIALYRTPKPQIPQPFEYTVTDPPGVHPGTHWIEVDPKGMVWFTDTWSANLGRLDPRTGDSRWVYWGLHGNVSMTADGRSIWRTDERKIKRYDTATVMDTGKPVQEFDLKNVRNTYGNFVSRDGRYFGGGANNIVWMDIQTGEIREVQNVVTGSSAKGRGDFDRQGNLWAGSRALLKYDPKLNVVEYYRAPTPHVTYYAARVDKNGHVWAGEMHGGRIAKFDPDTHHWTEYQLPSPWSFDQTGWIDNSTNPPSYWYGDTYGYIVHIQPME